MNSISIVFATFNRASIVRETLDAMTRLDRSGLDLEWVVINNNCTDDTDAVVNSFKDRLPLRLLHEPSPGKNRALNKGLKDSELRDIVVFTDDDVSPAVDWLQQISLACRRWPECSVFGGRIEPRWPSPGIPAWIVDPWIMKMGFAWHFLGETEREYPDGEFPYGPNFWVRKDVFANGRQYRESIGPKGTGRIMGSETSFLMRLREDGYRIVFCPGSRVEHRVKESDFEDATLVRRAMSCGRGSAHLRGINYHNLLVSRPNVWRFRQWLKLIRAYGRLAAGYCRFGKRRKMEAILRAYFELGLVREAFALSRD